MSDTKETGLVRRGAPDTFRLVPSSLGEAMEMAKLISGSELCPKAYRGKPADCIVAYEYGASLGLSWMQALRSVAVINGTPAIFGDAVPALIYNSGECERFHEYYEGAKDTDAYQAVCILKRKGFPDEVKRTFSIGDAKKAGLWGKAGPWQTYPDRMLRWRALGWGSRDTFADKLSGLILAEEAEDYPPNAIIDVTPISGGAASTVPPAVAAIEKLSDDIRTALEKGFDTLNLSPANRLAKLNEYLGRALAATDPAAPTLEQEGVALVEWCRTEFASRQGKTRVPKGEGNGKKVEPKAAEQGGAGATRRENAPARPTVHQADNLVEPPKDELTADEVFRKEPSVPPAKQDNLGF